jgi:hypothetical protein
LETIPEVCGDSFQKAFLKIPLEKRKREVSAKGKG